MTQMSPSQVRVYDPVLSNIALGYTNQSFVGSNLFPSVPVQVSGGQVLQFGKEAFELFNSQRAPGANTKRVQFGYLGKPFALVNHALEGIVPREHLRDASASAVSIDLSAAAVRQVMRIHGLRLEYDQAVLATTAGNYDATHKTTLVGTDKWNDASSDPIDIIETGKDAVRQSCGQDPNVLVLSASSFRALRTNTGIVSRFVYTDATAVTADKLASLLDIQKVVVGKAIYHNGSAFVDVWGDTAVMAYVPPGPTGMEEPSYGYTYTMTGHPMVQQGYYDENTQSWVYPVYYERAPVLTGVVSGYLISGTV